jgi:hypothetical protein
MKPRKSEELEDWVDRHGPSACMIEHGKEGMRISLLGRYPHTLSKLTPDEIQSLHKAGKLSPELVRSLKKARVLS